jgi:hypothetical protein
MPLFEVRVGVNKDGNEVYRVEAASVEDAVRKAREQEDAISDDFEYVRDEGMSSLTVNWCDVSESDVKPVSPIAPETMRIDYDDQLLDVIDKVNKILAARGLRFTDDGQMRDGYMIYTLESL